MRQVLLQLHKMVFDYVVGQIAIAQFANNIELKSVGNNLLAETTTSGKAIYTINNDNSTMIEAKNP